MVALASKRKHLIAQFIPTLQAEEKIRSAKNIARTILLADDISLKHKKSILHEVLWYLTEAEGKYGTRFRSEKVVDLANNEPLSDVRIHHEHVFTKKSVVLKITNNIEFYNNDEEALSLLLDESVGCIVTEEEHTQLIKDAEGWARYKVVPVYDMSFTPPRIHYSKG